MSNTMKFIISWASTTFALFCAIWLVPGIQVTGGAYQAPILTALVLTILGKVLTPLLQIISLPITIITLGIFALVVNTVVLEIASATTRGMFMQGITIDTFTSAFIGALIISIVSSLIYEILDD